MLELFEYWDEHPPTHEIAAAWCGYKKDQQAPLHFINGKQVRPTENQGAIETLARTEGVGTGLPPSFQANPEMMTMYQKLKRKPTDK